ncbi:APH(3') family aminoglycoside O-phosphotransferase [Streptomyces sp. URMC 124]|uniref:APH(3') family aminoglycoside O-phosphotransferase n=1 Tax=Streptomyces sp. URMC 124 TaxID=3423405 RepID=UPI003F1B5821
MNLVDKALLKRYPRHTWSPVTDGNSGAVVYRLSGASDLYVKVMALDAGAGSGEDLRSETERLRWLGGQGVPAPRVVDLGADDTSYWLVTEAVPGVPAAEWPRHQRRRVAEAMADAARMLHELPAADCPFDRRLAVTVPQAEHNARAGLVALDDLDDERQGWSAQQLLDALARTRPAVEEPVVCHGDLCPDNLLLDPTTCRLTGFIDVGRLGVADRHTDLALALRELRELREEEDPWFGPECVAGFVDRYGRGLFDEERLAFYRLLDEFF